MLGPHTYEPTRTPGLNFQALLAKAQFKSGQRTLPPPPEMRAHQDDKDTCKVVLRALQVTKEVDVSVADPRNKDSLNLVWDTNRDVMLKTHARTVLERVSFQ